MFPVTLPFKKKMMLTCSFIVYYGPAYLLWSREMVVCVWCLLHLYWVSRGYLSFIFHWWRASHNYHPCWLLWETSVLSNDKCPCLSLHSCWRVSLVSCWAPSWHLPLLLPRGSHALRISEWVELIPVMGRKAPNSPQHFKIKPTKSHWCWAAGDSVLSFETSWLSLLQRKVNVWPSAV